MTDLISREAAIAVVEKLQGAKYGAGFVSVTDVTREHVTDALRVLPAQEPVGGYQAVKEARAAQEADIPKIKDAVRLGLQMRQDAEARKEGKHPDDVAVDRFAVAMKAKLAAKRAEGRGGWDGPSCDAEFLSSLLREHVDKGDPLDVGNLAMMLHQRGEMVTQSEAQAPAVKVRPLEWKARNEKYEGRVYYGMGVFEHWYAVRRYRLGDWGVMHHVGGSAVHLGPYGSLEAAKADAQADYAARILAAIEPAQGGEL